MQRLTPAARAWLAEATGIHEARLRLTRLRGSTSATLYRVTDAAPGSSRRFVLRLFTLASWLEREPDLARHEGAALTEAAAIGLPVPELVAYLPGPSLEDPSDPVGFGAPALLMTHLPGEVVLAPEDGDAWLRELARTLAAIHEHPAPGFAWTYESWVEPENVTVPAWTRRPGAWEAAIAAYRSWQPDPSERTFLHRDYHQLNLLFEGTGAGIRTAGVVDWVNACLGPAAADVALCRSNLLQMKGRDAADAFLRHYREQRGGFDYDPAWDLEAVFDHGPEPRSFRPWSEHGIAPVPTEELRRRVEDNVLRALADLGVTREGRRLSGRPP